MYKFALLITFFSVAQVVQAHTETVLTATLDYTTVLRGGVSAPFSPATGSAVFTLTQPEAGELLLPTLQYSIEFNGLDLDGNQTPTNPSDNVTAVHLHDTSASTDTGGTPHVLNIYGMPRGGDDNDDMVFDAAAGTIAGLWEDSDAEATFPPSLELSTPGLIEKILTGEVYLMVHTAGGSLPGGETLGGFVTVVPEPTTLCLLLLSVGIGTARRCRA